MGAYKEVACQVAGIDYSTFAEWIRRGEGRDRRKCTKEYADFAEVVTQAITDAEMTLITRVRNASAEDWRAASWMLERRHPERWSNMQRVKIEVERELESQFDLYFEEVMNDPEIPTETKRRLLEHARNLQERAQVRSSN